MNRGDDALSCVKVGTRKSELALKQTYHVVEELEKRFPKLTFEIVAKTTTGDERLEVALNKIGEKSLFTKELEVALENNEVDMVVHSSKDLPTELPKGMVIGAIMEREDPRDAVLMKTGSESSSLASLPPGSRVGTSSVRRTAQIKVKYPNLIIKDVRGNLNTRLRKLDAEDGAYDALVLAAAGVIRMNWRERITELLQPSDCLHAVGQGALAIEVRENDHRMQEIVESLHHPDTLMSCIAERAFMRKLEGGCSAPVAAHAEIKSGALQLDGGVWSLDGKKSLRDMKEVKLSQMIANEANGAANVRGIFSSCVANRLNQEDLAKAEKLGEDLASDLINRGAMEILQEARIASSA